jgi:hypothetical protein
MTAPHCGQRKTVADGLGEVDICMWSSNRISLAFQWTKVPWRNRVFCERKQNAPIGTKMTLDGRALGADLLRRLLNSANKKPCGAFSTQGQSPIGTHNICREACVLKAGCGAPVAGTIQY